MPYKPKLYTDDELYDILMNSDFENIEAEHSIANNRSYNDSGSELSDLDENENNDENYDYESESADSSEDENNSATESDEEKSVPPPPKRARKKKLLVPDEQFTWKKIQQGEFIPEIHTFSDDNAGCKANLGDSPSVLECFEVFFSNEFIDNIVSETNNYYQHLSTKTRFSASSRARSWTPVDRHEMYIFIAVTLLMPLTKKQRINDYWSTDSFLLTPAFGQIMPRDRYLLLLKMLHFGDNDNPNQNDKLFKIRLILDHLRQCFTNSFEPFQNVCIDESLMLFKGRISFKQYIPSKRHRFGIKLFILCDCETSYILDFIIYTGSNTEITQFPEVGISGSIVLTLSEKYLNSGHSLYVDNWYASPSLFSILHEKKTNSCGTVKMNRKHMPPLQEKFKRDEYVCYSTKNILATKWQDKREVRMLSTMHTDEMIICGKTLQGEDKQKPSCISNYNENMGAIGKTDMLLSSTESVRKTIKWYKKVFLHLLDLSVLNAHVIYKVKTGDHMPLLKFQMKLVKELVDKYQMVRPRASSSKTVGEAVPMRLVARHFPSHVEKNQNNKVVAKRCVVCRRHKIRKETSFRCAQCNVPLCILTFRNISYQKKVLM
ncbi:hypothetical protein JTB14_038395 [Gonioctena quinquepunctata]|nr:hypothetical protein JTB14_038395 [Gonioctena quinquepunctata]